MIIAQSTADECGYICHLIDDRIDNQSLAEFVETGLGKAVAVLLIVGVAVLLIRLARRSLPRAESAWLKRQTAESKRLSVEDKTPNQVLDTELRLERAKQRAHTMQLVSTSIITGLIWLIAVLVVLDQFGVNLAPILAGAGVLGIAIGFGAQNMVKDFLAGIFIVLEDQYGVGDVVDLGSAIGTVEQVNLRSTRLRDHEGVVWYVPNGQILRVGNMSQLWSKAVLDISVGYDTDLDQAERVLVDCANRQWQSDDHHATIIEEPQFLGVQRFEADGVILRLVIKTEPTEQWTAARSLRKEIKQSLDVAGIEMPYPQRSIHIISRDEVAKTKG